MLTLGYDTKADVMRWMIDSQLGRRNLSPIQRISIAKKYENELREEAKENQGMRTDLLSNWTESENIVSTETRKEIAKLADIGSGTLARYDVVMKSDDENTKKITNCTQERIIT